MELKKTLFIVPPYIDKNDVSGKRYDARIEDLGVEYLYAYFTVNRKEAEILHCPILNYDIEDVVKYIEKNHVDYVGISLSFEATEFISTNLLANHIKEKYPHIFLFVGGQYATVGYEDLLKNNHNIDAVVLGEGEITTLQLINAIEKGDRLYDVKGIAFRNKDNTILRTNRQNLIEDLDTIPWPLRESYSHHVPKIASIESSRGCWGKCKFCTVQNFFENSSGKRWRSRSAANIVEEMSWIMHTWGINFFNIIDDNFLGYVKCDEKILDFKEALILEGIKISFMFACRSDSVKKERFSILKEIGLKKVFLGIESGSDTTLKRYGKFDSVKKNKEALEILTQLEIDTQISIILFDPWMKWDEFCETIIFLNQKHIYAMLPWEMIFNVYKPMVGSMFYEKYMSEKDRDKKYILYDEKLERMYKICNEINMITTYFQHELYYRYKKSREFTLWKTGLTEVILKFIESILQINFEDSLKVVINAYISVIVDYCQGIWQLELSEIFS